MPNDLALSEEALDLDVNELQPSVLAGIGYRCPVIRQKASEISFKRHQ